MKKKRQYSNHRSTIENMRMGFFSSVWMNYVGIEERNGSVDVHVLY